MVELDSGYMESWSLWSDVKLIAVTASLVLLRKGI
jgi:lipopolysaccharide/colanic/teichoic acid biosynthesis glycosyltransferase